MTEHITLEEILAKRTPRGSWTRAQLAEWGIPWPPPKGWMQKLTGDPNAKAPPDPVRDLGGYTIEIWQDNMKVASVFAESASEALWAAAGYAAQYAQDGDISIRARNPKRPRND